MLLFIFIYFASVALAYPYTWKFENNPTQCQSLRVRIQGDWTSNPPYRLLLVPFGTWPAKYNGQQPAPQLFTFSAAENNSWTLDFQLRYPVDSQLVAVVGDVNGFATGGTSMPWTVRGSPDSSCLDNTWVAVNKWPHFYISTEWLYSCESTVISWKLPGSNIVGNAHFTALYPGGHSFNLTTSPNVSGLTTTDELGFRWTVPFRQDAQVMLVSGDDSSILAPGGLDTYTVRGIRSSSTADCPLDMPTRTPGIPAGGDPNIDLDQAQQDVSVHRPSINLAAIIGGIVSGLLLLNGVIVGIWFAIRKTKSQKAQQAGPRPTLDDDDGLSHIIDTGPIEPFIPMHQTSSQVNYVRHRDSEDKLLRPSVPTNTVELPPDYTPNHSLPPNSTSTLIASDLVPI
ncbi:hypothetical protein DL96DRAFT_1469348 [Flagelloscypha sp. PMI_526]|nr:hypothetical protein DL96DRAFT_1469348 [Flagelloscypha sp. PMI_526]